VRLRPSCPPPPPHHHSTVTSINSSTTTRIASGTETLTSLGVPWYGAPCGLSHSYRFWVFALRAGAPVIAPPTNFFVNRTSLPRPSLHVLAELASSALNCTVITTKFNHSSGGAGCTDPLTACTPSASTSSSTPCQALAALRVWALPAYFYTMRVNVQFTNVLALKDPLLAKTSQQLGVSLSRLIFADATRVSDSLTSVTLAIVERPMGSTEPNATTAADTFLKSAAAPASELDRKLLTPGATTLLDTSYPVTRSMRYACFLQMPQVLVDDPALCSAPSYVAPALPTPAPVAPGTAAGVTVSFKLSGVDITTFSRVTFAAAVARTLGLASAAALTVDVRAGSVVVSVLLPYATFGSAQTAGAAATLLVAQARDPNSVLGARLAAAGMTIDTSMNATTSVAFACGGASASPSCASAPTSSPPASALSADMVLGLAIGGGAFCAVLIGIGLYYYCRLRTAELLAARAKIGGAHAGGDAMLETELQHRGSGSSSSNAGTVGISMVEINAAHRPQSHRQSMQDTTSFSYVERPPM
jgi:hypothetical protein